MLHVASACLDPPAMAFAATDFDVDEYLYDDAPPLKKSDAADNEDADLLFSLKELLLLQPPLPLLLASRRSKRCLSNLFSSSSSMSSSWRGRESQNQNHPVNNKQQPREAVSFESSFCIYCPCAVDGC
jgi:hypothetical protein